MVLDTCTSLFSLRSSDPFPHFFLSPFHAISVQISVALFRFFRCSCHRVSYDESFYQHFVDDKTVCFKLVHSV